MLEETIDLSVPGNFEEFKEDAKPGHPSTSRKVCFQDVPREFGQETAIFPALHHLEQRQLLSVSGVRVPPGVPGLAALAR